MFLRFLSHVTLIAVLLLLQVSILPLFIENAFKPNLFIILVCYLALRGEGTVSGALISYLTALFADVYSGLYFGLSGVSYLLIYLMLRKLSDKLYTESPQLMLFAVLCATIADSLITLIFTILFSNFSSLPTQILTLAIPQATVTTLVAYSYFTFLSFLQRRTPF